MHFPADTTPSEEKRLKAIIAVLAVLLFTVVGCTPEEVRESDKSEELVEVGLDIVERRTTEGTNPTTKEVGAIASAIRNIPDATTTSSPFAPDVCDIGNAESDERYNRIVGAWQFKDLLPLGSYTEEELQDMYISYDNFNSNRVGLGSREKPDNAAAWFFDNIRYVINVDLLDYALMAYYDFHATYPDANVPEWYNMALLDLGTLAEEADAKFEFEQLEESSDYLIKIGEMRYVGDFQGAIAVFNVLKFLSRVVNECGNYEYRAELTEELILKLEGHPIPTPTPAPTPTASELEGRAWEARLEQIEEEIEKSQSAPNRMDLYKERAEIRKRLTELDQ